MAYVVLVVLLLAVVFVVSTPLRSPAANQGAEQEETRSTARRDLEAARDGKYREIRDAELDHQTGKLSDADFAAVDAALRAEAVEILRRLDRSE
jgi:type II secretory pathway component PulM